MIQFCNLICGLKRNNFSLSLVGLQGRHAMMIAENMKSSKA